MSKIWIRDDPTKIKYAKELQAELDKWESKPPEEMIAYEKMFQRGVQRFILMWDIIKRIENKFNIDVKGILRDEIWKNSYRAGQKLAENYKTQGLKDLYDAFLGFFELFCKYEWFEFNDQVLEMRCHDCPNVRHFQQAGWSREQIAEVAPFVCLADIGVMTGFNPRNEVFPQPRLILKGDPVCSYRVEAPIVYAADKPTNSTSTEDTIQKAEKAKTAEITESPLEEAIKPINF